MKEQINFLYHYNQWASALMWQAINQLTDEQWQQSQAYSLGSVREHVLHVMYASTRWLFSLQGLIERPVLVQEDFPQAHLAQAKWHAMWQVINSYVFALNEADLLQDVSWGPTSRGYQGVTPCWQLLNHLANHATDHRSQILMLMNTQYGIQTPEQDMIFYIDALAKTANN